MAGEVCSVICGRRAFARNMNAKKTLAKFFAALCGSFLQYFAKNVYEPNFALFLVISTLIFCSLCLMFSMFCVLFFVGGLPHKKGVCIRSLVLNCCNLFDSKWRVNYLALFVVSAVSHAIRMQITFSRIFFSAFWEFPPNFCRECL